MGAVVVESIKMALIGQMAVAIKMVSVALGQIIQLEQIC